MELNIYLKLKFEQLSFSNICSDNDFLTYENFKKFILDHYYLDHMEKHNYIKFVKVKRQILRTKNEIIYSLLLKNINDTIKIMYDNHIFPNIDIKKYMYKIYNIFKIIEERKISISNTIKTIKNLYYIKDNPIFRMKILIGINTLTHRYMILLKNSKKLIYLINKLMELEYSYGIDHKLIELNNMERSYLGKRSEYTASKIMSEFVKINNKNDENINNNINKIYYYEPNIDLLKLFNIQPSHNECIKGEVDGILISYYDNSYIIDKIIEVKSSIKSTFEDIKKFIGLQKYINNMDDNIEITYKNFIFNKKSFINIINKDLTNWVIYLCINNIENDFIEKSHLYFSTCLKIIDDNFIKDFYIDNCDNVIKQKYNIIIENKDNIEQMFTTWINNIKLYNNECNIYISKK
jgi:hypothetical protein